MIRKIAILSLVFIFAYASTADAQRWRTRRYLAYVGAGTANYYGDIGGALTEENWFGLKDIDIEFTRPSLAAGVKYKLNHRWNARVNLAGAYLQGNDLNSKNESRYGGGYEFTSIIFEPSALAEFYIIPESRSMVSQAIYNKNGMVNGFRSINLYAFTGAGAVVNFPTVKYMQNDPERGITAGDEVIDDGFQDPEDKFRRVGAVIPVGIGAQMSLTVYWTLNVEFGRRFTFTDYVDGYTSIYSNTTDVYDFLNVIFCYKIRTDKNGLPVLFRRTGLN